MGWGKVEVEGGKLDQGRRLRNGETIPDGRRNRRSLEEGMGRQLFVITMRSSTSIPDARAYPRPSDLMILFRTVLLLSLSNIFMTCAWYAHLRELSDRPWYIAAFASWGVAL